ncbi:MAG TPA: BON domain-containing protein [Anaerolineales bacterium]|nr:BON domain-containing protein [Anaerolineales bacterium]
MSLTQISNTEPDAIPRYKERKAMTDYRKSLRSTRITDAVLKEYIYHAFWKDHVLREIEYYEIDVHVKNGTVYLHGHIVDASTKSRIENAIQAIPGINGIQNDLVIDDSLSAELAESLGKLEHAYCCKFYTRVSHGVVSLNGLVSSQNLRLLAEECAASNPNVRGVINNIHIIGARMSLQDQPFLQPGIGEVIYFLDGISGVVRQVIINPHNRRVIAMTIQGHFTHRRQEFKSLSKGEALPPERILILPMMAVRYLTRVSGFLDIQSNQRERYIDFDPSQFIVPRMDWKAPYPYCLDDILFPVDLQAVENTIENQFYRYSFPNVREGQSLKEQLVTNDSLGG